MADRISHQQVCPSCGEDNVEKVGWSYWYCGSCTALWEFTPQSGGKLERIIVPSFEPNPKEISQSAPPNPSKLELISEPDFPTNIYYG